MINESAIPVVVRPTLRLTDIVSVVVLVASPTFSFAFAGLIIAQEKTQSAKKFQNVQCVYLERTRQRDVWCDGMHNALLHQFRDRILFEVRDSLIAVKKSELQPIDLDRLPVSSANRDWKASPLRDLHRGTLIGLRHDRTLMFVHDTLWTLTPKRHIDTSKEVVNNALHDRGNFNLGNFDLKKLDNDETERVLARGERKQGRDASCHFFPGTQRSAFQSFSLPFSPIPAPAKAPDDVPIGAPKTLIAPFDNPREQLPSGSFMISEISPENLLTPDESTIIGPIGGNKITDFHNSGFRFHTIVEDEAIYSTLEMRGGKRMIRFVAVDLDDSRERDVHSGQIGMADRPDSFIHENSLVMNEIVDGRRVIKRIDMNTGQELRTIQPPEGWQIGFSYSVDSSGNVVATAYRNDAFGFAWIAAESPNAILIGEVPAAIMAPKELLMRNVLRQRVYVERNHWQFVFDENHVYFVGIVPERLRAEYNSRIKGSKHTGNFALYRMPIHKN